MPMSAAHHIVKEKERELVCLYVYDHPNITSAIAFMNLHVTVSDGFDFCPLCMFRQVHFFTARRTPYFVAWNRNQKSETRNM